MKASSVLLKAIIICSSIMISKNLMASTCSSKQLLVCSSAVKDVCIADNSLKSYFVNNPSATVGECAKFDIKKIKSYACNAGLRFIETSADAKNDLKANYFNFSIADYTENDSNPYVKRTMNASSNNEYAMASKKSGDQILKGGSELQFNFGSDLYGAEYFIDLCIINKNINPSRFDLDISGRVLFTNSVFNTANYNNASALYSRVELACVNSDGSQSNKTLVGDSTFTEAEKKYSRTITGSNTCVVRHYFKESAKAKARENSYKKVTFQTDVSVTPTDSTLLEATPVKFCKIKKGNKDSYTCTEKIYASAETFMKDILVSTFFDSDTYSGACPKNCKPF